MTFGLISLPKHVESKAVGSTYVILMYVFHPDEVILSSLLYIEVLFETLDNMSVEMVG